MKIRTQLLILATLALFSIGGFHFNFNSYAFTDVSNSNLYHDAISYLDSNNIVSGFSDGTYGANKNITRAEFTKIIMNSLFPEEVANCNTVDFPDVDSNDVFAPFICVAQTREIVGGFSDGNFYKDRNITAGESMKILSNAYGLTSSTTSGTDTDPFEPFISALSENSAVPISIVSLDDPLRRGETAEFIYRLDNNLTNKASLNYSNIDKTSIYTNLNTNGNEVIITESDGTRTFTSNGIPEHITGDFPNSRNPNTISEQSQSYTMTLTPTFANQNTELDLTPFGIAINGVIFDPNAAEYWNDDRNSGWQYEALSGFIDLGMDSNNAHVQPDGTYHYHGIPSGLVTNNNGQTHSPLVGYAADGFPVYVIYGFNNTNTPTGFNELSSSYQVKSGTRPDGPGGTYDGTYVEDYEYVAGSGDLDECNGRTAVTPDYTEGTYAYFLTDEFPFVPRCLKGEVDSSFMRGGGENSEPHMHDENGNHVHPPRR